MGAQENEQRYSKVARLLEPGLQLTESYTVKQLIGVGTFGQVYRGLRRGGGEVAIKASKADEGPLEAVGGVHNEAVCLNALNHLIYKRYGNAIAPIPIPLYLGYGRLGNVHYIVMEFCGTDMSVLRRRSPDNRLPIATSLWMMKKMVSSLHFLHDLGFLHRDVKPGNFCFRHMRNGEPNLFVIDFGMARYYRTLGGELKPRRPSAHFHGTVRYASLTTHKHQDMCRFDDLWPVYYISVENMVGYLPWGYSSDKDEVRALKETTDLQQLKYGEEAGPPSSMVTFCKHLHGASFYTEPDYHRIYDAINLDMANRKFSSNDIVSRKVLAATSSVTLNQANRGKEERPLALLRRKSPCCGGDIVAPTSVDARKSSHYAMDEEA